MDKELVKRFNENLKHIKRQLSSGEVKALYVEYSPESDEHLAKILALRGVAL